MKTIMDYMEVRFPTLNDIDRAHLESLLKELIREREEIAYNNGWVAGRVVGTNEGMREEKNNK